MTVVHLNSITAQHPHSILDNIWIELSPSIAVYLFLARRHREISVQSYPAHEEDVDGMEVKKVGRRWHFKYMYWPIFQFRELWER